MFLLAGEDEDKLSPYLMAPSRRTSTVSKVGERQAKVHFSSIYFCNNYVTIFCPVLTHEGGRGQQSFNHTEDYGHFVQQ